MDNKKKIQLKIQELENERSILRKEVDLILAQATLAYKVEMYELEMQANKEARIILDRMRDLLLEIIDLERSTEK